MPDWAHAPIHKLEEPGAYMVTAGTYLKRHIFTDGPRLTWLHDKLLELAMEHEWQLQAWAVFSNHYHFVGITEGSAESLTPFTQELHSVAAIEANKWDRQAGRKVWFQYRETHLSYQRSYLARLNYVHHNAVKHGLVKRARDYPYCSAGWFERTAPASFAKTVRSFKTDRLNVEDDF